MDLRHLIQKYSVSGPRYTSYPTAPSWTESLKSDAYRDVLRVEMTDEKKPLALYLHIPFCEALCYYCGCNIQITKDRSRGGAYIERMLREMKTVAQLLAGRRTVSQISWGGGTPTFLSVEEITRLHQGTRDLFDLASDAEVSIEVDPRVTSTEQLECLRSLGFNRVSLGVQDFDRKVQEAINRLQSPEMTRAMLEKARALGFRGINFDLIYGLPHQSLVSFEETVKGVVEARPDRIALYNYAHLPQMIKHQRILDKLPMPSPEERVDIFTMAFDYLTRHGYHAIGMDHFAQGDDELYKAIGTGTLYRNFMGYTVKRGTDMVGIGVSAIGELGSAYFQNAKEVKAYETLVDTEGLATYRGCRLTEEDRRRKWVIQSLMCRFALSPAEYAKVFPERLSAHFGPELAELQPFYADGILQKDGETIRVTSLGRLFIRNVAMIFDEYLRSRNTAKPATYSRTV